MADGVIISQNEYNLFKRMLDDYKRNRGQQPQVRRRRGIMASGGGESVNTVHKAYMKAAATAGATDTCYLDTDGTGEEITVNFSIAGGSDLDEAAARLADGSLIFVQQFDSDWYCVGSPFAGSEPCICEAPP